MQGGEPAESSTRHGPDQSNSPHERVQQQKGGKPVDSVTHESKAEKAQNIHRERQGDMQPRRQFASGQPFQIEEDSPVRLRSHGIAEQPLARRRLVCIGKVIAGINGMIQNVGENSPRKGHDAAQRIRQAGHDPKQQGKENEEFYF